MTHIAKQDDITQELLALKSNKQLYKIIHYIITQSSGDKKYMAAMVYNDLIMTKADKDQPNKFLICPKAMIFVSDFPAFKVLS